MSKNKQNTEVAVNPTPQLPVEQDYSAYAGQGFETHTREDYAVPFLGVVQSNSPIVDTNPEARPGMLMNTVTQDLYKPDPGVVFIPAHTQHVVVEWKPRDAGGGFVGIHAMESDIVRKAKEEQEFGKWKTVKGDPKSNDLIETFYVYGILVDTHGNSQQMIMTFSSTKIKKYKAWMTKARTIQITQPNGQRINPPLFAHKYKITTVKEENTKGSFYNYQIEFATKDAAECRLSTKDPLFLEAVAFADLVKTGNVKAANDTQEEPTNNEDIPFN